ncbi:MAG: YbaN family protein [Thermoplasmata archaeon]|nr:MAG: YbaN family protein [Thermoplasmata archaeon]
MGRALWTAAGTFFLALGIIGIVIPLLPTTPFLLLAAACYLRGSERMHKWLLNHRWFGEYIRNYQEGRGIPLKAKITAISFLWIAICFSAFFFVDNIWIRIILIAIAVGVSIHIISLKTLRK